MMLPTVAEALTVTFARPRLLCGLTQSRDMKTLLPFLAAAALAFSATAQTNHTSVSTNVSLAKPVMTTNAVTLKTDPAFETQINHPMLELQPSIVRPNAIPHGRITYSGSVVQVIKTHSLLQLINPFAPSDAGSGEDNVAINPMDGKAAGLKLFAIQF